MYFFEYKLFRMKVLFLSIITLGIYKKTQKYEIELQNELLDKILESFDEEYKKVEEEIKKKCYSKNFEQINSYFEAN